MKPVADVPSFMLAGEICDAVPLPDVVTVAVRFVPVMKLAANTTTSDATTPVGTVSDAARDVEPELSGVNAARSVTPTSYYAAMGVRLNVSDVRVKVLPVAQGCDEVNAAEY